MTRLFITLTLLSILFSTQQLFAQSDNKREFEVNEGAKTYTMKKYYLCFLYKGEQRKQDTASVKKIQRAHMKYIATLADKEIIQLAGPFGHNGNMRGLLLFDVATKEEAIRLTKLDPAVQAGRLRYEIFPWWGAKGSQLK